MMNSVFYKSDFEYPKQSQVMSVKIIIACCYNNIAVVLLSSAIPSRVAGHNSFNELLHFRIFIKLFNKIHYKSALFLRESDRI